MSLASLFTENDPQCYEGKVGINPSPQQGTFFTFVVKDSRSALLTACAGSGKTTTIIEACKLLKPGFAARFLAFNKSIATELEKRLPRSVASSTFHSAWFNALTRTLSKRPKVDANKVRNILKDSLKYKDFEVYGKYCERLVGFAKNMGMGQLTPNIESEWYSLIRHFSLTSNEEDLDESLAVRYAMAALADSTSYLDVIDFDDMLYLSLLRNVSCDKSNYIFIDESQDLSSLQHALLARMLAKAPGCPSRVFAVGDRNQAIYGFRGAASDSMDQLRDTFNCIELPLSVSYRCSKAVVAETQRILNQ